LSVIEAAHKSLMKRLESSKEVFAKQSKKELNALIWSLGGASEELVASSGMQTESRTKFIDAFVKNIDTFFSLYMRRMRGALSSSEN